jgi:hypothetical protein
MSFCSVCCTVFFLLFCSFPDARLCIAAYPSLVSDDAFDGVVFRLRFGNRVCHLLSDMHTVLHRFCSTVYVRLSAAAFVKLALMHLHFFRPITCVMRILSASLNVHFTTQKLVLVPTCMYH